MTRLRNRHFLISDLLLLTLVAYLSFVLRLERLELGVYRSGFLLFTALALVVTPVIFRLTGVYSRYWRYASIEEMLLLAGTSTLATLMVGIVCLVTARFLPGHPILPRSIPLIFLPLALLATGGPRFLVRVLARSSAQRLAARQPSGRLPHPVLIVGAGDAGSMIVREMQANPYLGLDPVGFLDDDPAKHHLRIHGVPVLGDRHAIPRMVREYRAEEVIIAMPTVPGPTIRDIVLICDQAGVRTRIIPGMYAILDGTASLRHLREVRIEDLLRREPLKTDITAVAALLHGKRVLVTGGGGSIGSELCRQILHCDPAELVLVGHGENSIFEIHNELRAGVGGEGSENGRQEPGSRVPGNPQSAIHHPGSRIVPIIADIRDPERLHKVFRAHRPEIVFHAAAHKHVPLMEANVEEAVTNNVLGTRYVVEASIAAGVDRFVLISTDKAVNPTSVMGASKRVAELIVLDAAQRTGRPFVAVRFGNVLGSRGSVIPHFQKQIAAGGPVTVTHPEVKRYFMTIPEAVQLVLQAVTLGKGGEVFVLDMGEPVKIVDLAADLIRLSGLQVGRDIEITYTGLRPGEKLFEELFAAGEAPARTAHEKIFVCQNGFDIGDLGSVIRDAVDGLAEAARVGDVPEVRRRLMALVSEQVNACEG